MLAADMRACQSAVVPNGVNERLSMFDRNSVFATVDGEVQRIFFHSVSSDHGIDRSCPIADSNARRTMTAVRSRRYSALVVTSSIGSTPFDASAGAVANVF